MTRGAGSSSPDTALACERACSVILITHIKEHSHVSIGLTVLTYSRHSSRVDATFSISQQILLCD